MQGLSPDSLHCVLEKLELLDLLSASSSCRQLRQAAWPASPLWAELCRRRWGGSLNAALYPFMPPQPQQQLPGIIGPAAAAAAAQAQQRIDHKALLLQDNGWAGPRLSVQRYAGCSWSDELAAAQPGATAADGSCTVAVSSCQELRILHLGGSPTDQVKVRRAGNHGVHSAAHGGEVWSSVSAVPAAAADGDAGLVAAGGCRGRLALFQLPEWSSGGPCHAAVQPMAVLAFPGNSCIISQLQYLPAQQRLLVLHDCLAHLRPAPQQHSMLSMVDAATWRPLSPAGMTDVLEGYQVAAAAAVGASGSELIAGSIRLSDDQSSGWPCQRCYSVTPAALCWHKGAVSAAALCVFDCRAAAAGGMVARYATHHRSLYPHLEAVREHFLLTSHAGTPVAVWDRRQMNGPVHEVQHLPRELHPALAASLPLDHPDLHDPPASQALHLSATSDLLLGRADNGMCWLWDLSERMGWADGSQAGSWLRGWRPPPQAPAGGFRQGDAAAGGQLAGPAVAAVASADVVSTGAAWEASEGADGAEDNCEGYLDEHDFDRAPLPLGCIGAPYEVWCSNQGVEAPPLHWLPPAAAWIHHNRILALGGMELEDKQRLFPAHAQSNGSGYPSNTLVLASLQPPPPP